MELSTVAVIGSIWLSGVKDVVTPLYVDISMVNALSLCVGVASAAKDSANRCERFAAVSVSLRDGSCGKTTYLIARDFF